MKTKTQKHKKAIMLSIVISLISFTNINAASFYWVGGSGNWSDYANHWATTSGGTTFHPNIPTASDNVFFDANSFANAGQTVTLNQTTNYCKSMDWTGVTNNPTFNMLSNMLEVYGSFILNPVMSISSSSSGQNIFFYATTPGNTVKTYGQTLNWIKFDGVGGTWLLQDSLHCSNSVSIQAGTLTTNDHFIKIAQGMTISSGLSNNKSIILNLGKSVIQVKSWFVSYTNPNIVMNAGNSRIIEANAFGGGLNCNYNIVELQPPGNGSGQLYGLGTFNNVTISAGGSNNFMIIGQSHFKKLSILSDAYFGGGGANGSNNSFDTLILSPGRTYQVYQGSVETITANGILNAVGTQTSMITIQSGASGQQATFSKLSGQVCLNYILLKDMHATGGAQWYAGANSVNINNNTGWIFSSCVTAVEEYASNDMYVCPNPSNGKFTIQSDELRSESFELEIYNVLGEKVYSLTNPLIHQSTVIDVSSQPNGIYFLKVNTDKESFTQKMIIRK